jgi:hypothetical protein
MRCGSYRVVWTLNIRLRRKPDGTPGVDLKDVHIAWGIAQMRREDAEALRAFNCTSEDTRSMVINRCVFSGTFTGALLGRS